MSLLIAMLLAQASTIIVDPTVQSKRAKVTTTAGGALQVECVGGTCSGSSSGGGGDGGYTVVIQGPGADGGAAWGVTGTVSVVGPLTVNLADAGPPINVQGPLTDTQLRATPVPVSGTVTASGPLTDTQLRATPVPVSGTVTASGPLTDTQLRATPVPVSGTVTTTPPSNASTNVAQFGSTNVSTGAGVGGAGIPRVTVSSDSSLAANQSVNVSQINAVTPLMGVGASGTGAQRVAALIHDGTTTAGVIVATTALKTDLSSVAGTATSTAAAGVLKVGIVGNANAAIDAANNASAPANVWVEGWQLQSGATATAGTSGQVGSPVASLDHVPYARLGGPVTWACSLDNIGATLTQCQGVGGSGLKYYVTDIEIESTTATAGLFLVRTGTGTNCGTGTASLFPSAATVPRFGYPANTASNPSVFHFLTPLVSPAASEVCIICTVTNTCTVQMTGYTAP